ncbi:MAG TPA: molybdenum cofactor guanylyltransferase [Paenibacillus sp.]
MEITSIIIAGGRSSRMGTNKALLTLNGMSVIERMTLELNPVSQQILIAGGQHDDYNHLGLEVVADQYPDMGPLAGLHAGLSATISEWNLVVACDMPFVHRGVFEAIAERAARVEEENAFIEQEGRIQAIIVQAGGRIQPLLAAYSRDVLPGLQLALESGRLRMSEWVTSLHVDYIDGADLADKLGDTERMLQFNMNRIEDYEWVRTVTML